MNSANAVCHIIAEKLVTGTYNKRESWEKCQVWDLDNGWQAAINYNQSYGEFVSRLSKDGRSWYCSDGYSNHYALSDDPVIAKVFKDHLALPEFAREWLEVIHKLTGDTLVRPRFERKYTPTTANI